MRKIGRILLYVTIAIVALPFIYVVGIYAIVLGGYALVALGALTVSLFTDFPKSPDDIGAYAVLSGMTLATLAVCAGGLYLIWYGVRHFFASFRNR